MVRLFNRFATLGFLVKRNLSFFTIGGSWAYQLPSLSQRNLRWFFFDGFFASVSDNIVGTYLTLYILALGATNSQIGLLSSLSSLTAALLLLPGALLVERIGHRKEITVIFGGILSRLMILCLAIIPFIFDEPYIVLVAITLSVIKDAFANLPFPAWMALTADIVPLNGRGRYFGSRNFAMGMIGIITTLIAGETITRLGQPSGYQWSFLIAFLVGMASTISFSRIHDPQKDVLPVHTPSLSLPLLLRDLKIHKSFLIWCGVSILWNFSINLAGPFFNVYMVKNLYATATMVGIATIISTISSLAVQQKAGALLDRWGSQRLMKFTGLLIPILPLSWLFITSPWQIIPVNILGGALWGIFGLASFNLLLALTPETQRARYSAIFQIIVTLALAGGAIVGGWLVTNFGYQAIFLSSGLGRLAAAILFARLIPTTESPLGKESTHTIDL